jgi:hypothetical protein
MLKAITIFDSSSRNATVPRRGRIPVPTKLAGIPASGKKERLYNSGHRGPREIADSETLIHPRGITLFI